MWPFNLTLVLLASLITYVVLRSTSVLYKDITLSDLSQPYLTFTPTTSITRRFSSGSYIKAKLSLKVTYQADGLVFMDYTSQDNLLAVLIVDDKPVVRYSNDGDHSQVTFPRTPNLILDLKANGLATGTDFVTGRSTSMALRHVQANNLTSNLIRLGNSAPKALLNHPEYKKGFTGNLYWIRYINNYTYMDLEL